MIRRGLGAQPEEGYNINQITMQDHCLPREIGNNDDSNDSAEDCFVIHSNV